MRTFLLVLLSMFISLSLPAHPRKVPHKHIRVVHVARVHANAVQEDQEPLGIGMSLSSMILQGTKLTQSNLENPAMTGFNIFIRTKVDDTWGLEFAGGYLQGTSKNFQQKTIPLTLSALFYLFPESRVQPFLLGGTGLHLTTLSYQDRTITRELTEVTFHGGAGLQISLGKRLLITADGRVLTVYKNIGEQALCDGKVCELNSLPNDDKFNLGYQLSAGLAYYF